MFLDSVRENLKIKGGFTVQVFYQRDDFKDFIDLTDISQLKGKIPMIKVITKAQRFWNFVTNSDWITKGHAENKYESLLVKEGNKIYNDEVMEKFTNLTAQLGFNGQMMAKVFSISNPIIVGVFDSYRSLLFGKQRQSPQLFNKDDWKEMPDGEQRGAYVKWLNDYAAKFKEFNDSKSLPNVIPMIQGTSEEAVWQICQQGFGIASTTDDGFYGRGIYFTSTLPYASRYAKPSNKEIGYRVFLLSMVIPGNPYPVTENPWDEHKGKKTGYHGQACRPGYQSHFTLVNADEKDAFPTKLPPPFNPDKVADELVIFEASQALPLFVFYTR